MRHDVITFDHEEKKKWERKHRNLNRQVRRYELTP